MHKKKAKELLQVGSQGLADSLGVSEGHIRNMNDLTTTQEIIVNCLLDIDKLQSKITILIKTIDEITRANDC
jgi:predicted RNA-binding protein with RPS1 domain